MSTVPSVLTANVSADRIRTYAQWQLLLAARDHALSSSTRSSAACACLGRWADQSWEQRAHEKKQKIVDIGNVNVRRAMAENAWTRFAIAEDESSNVLLLEALAEDANPHVQNRAKQTIAILQAEQTWLTDMGRS
jgi:hypothetical protein